MIYIYIYMCFHYCYYINIYYYFYIPLLNSVFGYQMGHVSHLRTSKLPISWHSWPVQAEVSRTLSFANGLQVFKAKNRDSCHSQSPYHRLWALIGLIIKETYEIGSMKCWMLKVGNEHQVLSCQWFLYHAFWPAANVWDLHKKIAWIQ